MIIQDVINHLESIAPPVYQESYDNAGLITGNAAAEVQGVLVCLDSTEAVIEEAIELGCNLVVAHHPIVFRGLKKITGRNYVERVIIQAIKNDIAIYAIHTNLDNVYHQGVNARIAERLELKNTRILAPKQETKKLSTYVPATLSAELYQSLLSAGAQRVEGIRETRHLIEAGASPMINGDTRIKLEVSFPTAQQKRVLRVIDEYRSQADITYDLHRLENTTAHIGSGMVGELPEPMSETDFLPHLKEVMQAGCIRHTRLLEQPVWRVAVCGGSGGFLLEAAVAAGAQVFITADYKYHEFFDADGRILIADIGHYESEQFTINLLDEIISQKFSNFAVHCTKVRTNPVFYT